MFSKSEREYLLVEMQNIPVCLCFQPSVSILFPSQLAFIHLLHLPVSWRCLSLSSLSPSASALIILSLEVGACVSRLYSYSPPLENYPFKCIMPN